MTNEKTEWEKLYSDFRDAYANSKYDEASKKLVKTAYLFAKKKHKGQMRDGGEDYIIHPIRVARIVLENKRSSNITTHLCSALLHDTIEDTYTSYKELQENFGETIASLVMELSTASCACKIEGKKNYLCHKMEHMTSYALYVKLADRLDNITDLDHSPEEKRQRMYQETKEIIDYLSKTITFTSSQQKLVEKIKLVLKKKTA